MLDHLHRFALRSAALHSTAGIPASEGEPAPDCISSRTLMVDLIPGNSALIDIETLDDTPGSLITEIGLIAFRRADFEVIAASDLRLDLFDQLPHRSVSEDTIKFHRDNSTLPESPFGLTRFIAAAKIAEFIGIHKPKNVWIQGPCFERPIIEDLFRDLKQPLPWKFYRSRDCRTNWDTAFPDVPHPKRPHHALPDCFATLACLEEALTALGRRHAC